MRRIAFGFMSTLSALVLLFSYHTSLGSSSSSASGSTSGGSSGDSEDTGTSSGGSGSGSGSSSSKTYTGDAVNTRWGIVQVAITVQDGKITASDAVQYPTENPKDQQINAYAVPQLNSETVQAQSDDIDAVSGATVTSDGYIQSLQSALDEADL